MQRVGGLKTVMCLTVLSTCELCWLFSSLQLQNALQHPSLVLRFPCLILFFNPSTHHTSEALRERYLTSWFQNSALWFLCYQFVNNSKTQAPNPCFTSALKSVCLSVWTCKLLEVWWGGQETGWCLLLIGKQNWLFMNASPFKESELLLLHDSPIYPWVPNIPCGCA